eukprot:3371213-Amphidinium_carterae.1
MEFVAQTALAQSKPNALNPYDAKYTCSNSVLQLLEVAAMDNLGLVGMEGPDAQRYKLLWVDYGCIRVNHTTQLYHPRKTSIVFLLLIGSI